MSEVLRQLHEDHNNFAQLLSALERQLAVFAQGERPDYDILLSIADYFTGFPDCCHHPKEDLVLERLQARNPKAGQKVAKLDAEHTRLSELARHFRQAVENVLKEAEVPRGNFERVIRHFIDDQRNHMRMEEQLFFPLAREHLTAEDWAEIDAQASGESDPLFGTNVASQFASLRNDILRWEGEAQAAQSSDGRSSPKD